MDLNGSVRVRAQADTSFVSMETIWRGLLRIYINVPLAHERIILDRLFFLLTSIAIQSCQDERIGSDQIGVLVVLVDFVLVAKNNHF